MLEKNHGFAIGKTCIRNRLEELRIAEGEYLSDFGEFRCWLDKVCVQLDIYRTENPSGFSVLFDPGQSSIPICVPKSLGFIGDDLECDCEERPLIRYRLQRFPPSLL